MNRSESQRETVSFGCTRRSLTLVRHFLASIVLVVVFPFVVSGDGRVNVVRCTPVRLNNFVVELADIALETIEARTRFHFDLDTAGWLWCSVQGEGKVMVLMDRGCETSQLVVDSGESMRFVPAGPVSIEVVVGNEPKPGRLIVRRIAEIMAYFFEGHCTKSPQVDIKHSWDELDAAVLHSANVLVSRGTRAYEPYAKRWQAGGRRWLRRESLSPLRDDEIIDPAQYFRERLSGQVWDGATLDELLPRDVPHFMRYAEGLNRFSLKPEAKDKLLYWWIYSLGTRGNLEAIRILQTVCSDSLNRFHPTVETAVHGKASVRCMPSGKAVSSTRQRGIALKPGAEYTLSAYFRTDAVAATARTGLVVIDSGWRRQYAALQPPAGSADWVRQEIAFTPRPSEDGRFQIVLTAPSAGGLWVDGVQLEQGGKATPFTSGPRNLVRNPSFENGLYGWMSGAGESLPLVGSAVEYGHVFVQELYLLSERMEEEARRAIGRPLEVMAEVFRDYRGLNRHTLIAPLVYNAKPGAWCGNYYPDVNYKVFLDMQMQAMATQEGLEDLRGVSFWNAHYAPLETLNWFGALLRHYCIEGNTELLSADAYRLDHIANSGFEAGAEGWDTEGKVEIVATSSMPEGAFIDARRAPSVPAGKVLRTTRREGDEPCSFGQPIRNLEMGRLYSLKLYAANPDYSSRPVPAAIEVQGGKVRPCESRREEFSEHKGTHVWRTQRQPQEVYWTMHFRVFKATAEEGYLRVSDVEPGEVYWDFVQIEPYYEP